MKLPSRRVLGIVLGIALLFFSIVAYQFHYRWKWAVADYKSQLRASGEKLTVAELKPVPLPAGDNSAELFHSAAELLKDDEGLFKTNSLSGMKMVAPGHALVGWQQSVMRDYEGGKIEWLDVQSAVTALGPALAQLDGIAGHPHFDFKLEYEAGFSMSFVNLVPLKRASEYLCSAMMYELHRGDLVAATKHLRGMIALVKGMEQEPLAISQLVRTAIAVNAFGATWEWLQFPELTDDQLAVIESDWQSQDFVQAMERALEMERAMGVITLADWRRSNKKLRDAININWMGNAEVEDGDSESWRSRTWIECQIAIWRFYWSYKDELLQWQGEQVLVETLRNVQTNGSFKMALEQRDERLAELGFSVPRGEYSWMNGLFNQNVRTLLSQSVATLSRTAERAMSVEAGRRIAVLAIALKRYQLRHERLPEHLADLATEFRNVETRDPVDGQSLRYKPQPDGTYLLYSIGEDGHDDNGDGAPPSDKKLTYWLKGRDWVWPMPATAEEVEAYHKTGDGSN